MIGDGCLGLAAQKFVGVSGGYNCFLDGPWDWGLWYGPVIFNLIVGTTLMAIVILKVWRVRHHHHYHHLQLLRWSSAL
jgi:hypothetical protein